MINLKDFVDDQGIVNLQNADLQGADLRGADLREANLQGADLEGANLEGVILPFEIGIEKNLLLEIAQIVLNDNNKLNMGFWHTCDTIHCVLGWAINLSDQGENLEKQYGPGIAGLILLGREAHSHVYDSNDKAIEWLKTLV